MQNIKPIFFNLINSNSLKKIAFTGIFFISTTASSMSTAEACQWRGKMLGGVALERDKGIPRNKVVNEIYKNINGTSKPSVKRSTISDYVTLVYSNQGISADEFVKLGELSCRKEFGL